MKAKAVQIHWHNKQPIYSVDFHPQIDTKFATCGGDNNIRIWSIAHSNEDGAATVEYLTTLTKHMKSVNCVRFSPTGEYLASAGDGGLVILWKPSDGPIQFNKALGEDSSDEDTERKEFWAPAHQFRAMDGEDVYDLAWSPDSRYIVFGLTDNTAQIWDVGLGRCVKVLRDHQHFVQGVAWDPLNQLLVTQSSDRSVKIWTFRLRNGQNGNLQFFPLVKYLKNTNCATNDTSSGAGSSSLFHDETLVSFFRRPSFSPDGSLLVLPAALKSLELGVPGSPHGIYLNWRNNINQIPLAFIGGFEKAAIAVRFNPRLFPLIESANHPTAPFVSLPYRMIFAVLTQNSIYVFDTQRRRPIHFLSNFHYASLTDLAWSRNGLQLVVTSVDGFCTLASFDATHDFGAEPLSSEAERIYLHEDERVLAIKANPFHNPPPKINRKPVAAAAQIPDQMVSDPSFLISSEIDMIDIDNRAIGATGITETQPSQQASSPIIHTPQVKRRIAPTPLSTTTSGSEVKLQ